MTDVISDFQMNSRERKKKKTHFPKTNQKEKC